MSDGGAETAKQRWEREVVAAATRKSPERRGAFATASGQAVERLYDGANVADIDYRRDVGDPGAFPFVRGATAGGYRERPWARRQPPAGTTHEAVNDSYRAALARGETALGLEVDGPTSDGLDPDDARARGRVGHGGVSVASLADMARLFAEVPLGGVAVSMAVDAAAAPLFAMYLVAAEQQGVEPASLSGAVGNDALAAAATGRAPAFPLAQGIRLAGDVVDFCAAHVPAWGAVTVNAYAVREAGATAIQELAFAIASGLEHVRRGVAGGHDIDVIAPLVSVLVSAHSDFFEEVAKLRAARRLWAEAMRGEGARDARACQLGLHVRTAAAALTTEQPYNNVARTALQALSAVLGGAASLRTNALDEGAPAPDPHAAMVAARTQEIIAHESGVAASTDPLGGSYFIEALTRDMETAVRTSLDEIAARGGLLAAIDTGWLSDDIAAAAAKREQAIAAGDIVVVGVNDFVQEAAHDARRPDADAGTDVDAAAAESLQVQRIQALRAARNDGAVRRALDALGQAARGADNLMPHLLDAVRASATLGEMCGVLREVWGEPHRTDRTGDAGR